MKLRLLTAALAATALLAGVASAQDISSDKGKLSYYFGYQTGNNLAELAGRGEQIDVASVIKGLQDAYGKKDPAISAEQLKPTMEAFQKREEARAQQAKANYDKAAAENKTKSDAFITQYRSQAGVKTLPSGALYKVLTNGSGAKPTMASNVQLQVSGPFPWGQRPAQAQAPQTMPEMKLSAVEMPAMRDVLAQMPAGSKWEIALPPDKAYGADPRTGFPPNVAVVFEVSLVSVK
jgi:peptidylprolyl isomerase